jgi:6-phosphogluconolactonase
MLAHRMPMIERVELCQFPNPEVLARAAAERWLGPDAPLFRHVALSGGRIARLFLAAAAEMASANNDSARKLQQTHLFWADERCVPPTHPESNYRLAREELFDRLDLSSGLIHRLKGELVPERAADEANADLARTVPRNPDGLPMFDLVFLGMGEDGHIASLFPGGDVSAQRSRPAYAVVVGPKPPNPRITLTLPVLAAAEEAWVMVAGAGKELILRNSLQGNIFTPLTQLIHTRKSTRVLVDRFFLNNTAWKKVESSDK